jgi:hypothetical protein
MRIFKYPLPVLMVLFYILNLLDYATTAYCLENIPNAREMNPWLQTPDVQFRFKILYGTPVWIAYFLIGLFFERIRLKYSSMPVRFCYLVMLVAVLTLVVQYLVTVVNNFLIILTYG